MMAGQGTENSLYRRTLSLGISHGIFLLLDFVHYKLLQLLLDEPTNHLDMESIYALAKAVNEFQGGMVLVSHDMRLISQVAKEIWICDHKTITTYKGDIQNFKMDMRAQMGIEGQLSSNVSGGTTTTKLRGDASVKASEKPKEEKPKPPPPESKLSVIKPTMKSISEEQSRGTVTPLTATIPSVRKDQPTTASADDATTVTASTSTTTTSADSGSAASGSAAPKKYIPPHLRKKMSA